MKIKILTGCSGLDFSFCAGKTVEVPDELGHDLVSGALAEEIKPAPAKAKAGAKDNAEPK